MSRWWKRREDRPTGRHALPGDDTVTFTPMWGMPAKSCAFCGHRIVWADNRPMEPWEIPLNGLPRPDARPGRCRQRKLWGFLPVYGPHEPEPLTGLGAVATLQGCLFLSVVMLVLCAFGAVYVARFLP